ncbi:MAG TPA: response regulator [Thermoplasmata archaeon]|nr:response regulator [Thermoplasmata archaeon]
MQEHFHHPVWVVQGTSPWRSSGKRTSEWPNHGILGGLCIVTIFLVDDEKFIVDLYRDILEANGHTVVGIASDGEEAVRKYREMGEKPVIIIMDQRMPVKDGVSATQEILKMDPSATIFFGSADLHIEKEALAAGAKGFLLKPFRIEELLQAITEAAADKLKVKS